jgi:predicted SAM-dependent methyltransferase
MISRRAKAAYYSFMGIPMRVNGWLYRVFRAPHSGPLRVHLGPGKKSYLEGWTNVDANIFTARADVWADLRNPLPFRDQTVDVFYSHHVIEHIADSLLPFHFGEMYRCLKPGGVIRIGGPHGDNAIRKFSEKDAAWFSDFPEARRSIGGRFANFILCRGEHLTILTRSYLEELLAASGFVDIVPRRPCDDTGHPRWIDSAVLALEAEKTPECPHTLLMEARKPDGGP